MLAILGTLLFALASALYPPRPPSAPDRAGDPTTVVNLTVILIAMLLAGSLAAQEYLINILATNQLPFPAWLRSLPAIPILDTGPLNGHLNTRVSILAEILAILQTALLATLVIVVRKTQLSANLWLAVGCAAAVMAAIALSAHGLLSDDVYAYIGYGSRGTEAYIRRKDALPSSLSGIYPLWGNPLTPCAYGPAWLIPATWLMHGVATLSDGLIRFRIAGLVSVSVLIAGLRRLGSRPSVILTAALNPFLWQQYVADAHNDLWPIALIVVALSQSSRPLIAIALAGIAGAVKIPFIVIGCLVGSRNDSTRVRIFIALGSALVGTLLSGALGFSHYFNAIEITARRDNDSSLGAFRLIALAACGLTMLWAVLGRRCAWGSGFGFQSIGFAILPWYAIWGFAAAIMSADADIFLSVLPIVAFLTTTQYVVTVLWMPLLAAAFIVFVFIAYLCLRDSVVRLKQTLEPMSKPA